MRIPKPGDLITAHGNFFMIIKYHLLDDWVEFYDLKQGSIRGAYLDSYRKNSEDLTL